MLKDLTPAQRQLAEYMSELSEDAYCAGWMDGLEFALWRAVTEGPREYGFMHLSREQIERLGSLSEKCGGWIVFDDELWETWVPLSEWRRRYDADSSGR